MWQDLFRHRSAFVNGLFGTIATPPGRRDSMQIDVTILLRDRVASVDAPVLDKLRKAGVSIENVLIHLSVVTGKIDPDRMVALQALPEISAIEEAGVFHAAPAAI
jgi:hypothetical protein